MPSFTNIPQLTFMNRHQPIKQPMRTQPVLATYSQPKIPFGYQQPVYQPQQPVYQPQPQQFMN
jgi:hypothetical protein